MAAYNIIEITSNQLTDANLRNAITTAGTTQENDLIVVRTTTLQNTITLSGTELGININASQFGSVTIVSLGDENLTIDANRQSRVFSIGDIFNSANGEVALAGLIITGGHCVNYGDGGGIYSNSGANLYNTVVANNSSDVYYYDYYSGTVSGSNNLIGNGSGQSSLVDGTNGNIVGTANAPIDPLFVDAANGDYRLATGSPAINAGDNALAVEAEGNPLTMDLAGNVRIQGGTVDMGAYEYEILIPAIPTNVVALSSGANEVTLTWDASGGATSYHVYRYGNSTWTLIATTNETTYTNINLTTGKSYSFRVAAANSQGVSAQSVTVVATPGVSAILSPMTTALLDYLNEEFLI